jgi:hypothetical protein
MCKYLKGYIATVESGDREHEFSNQDTDFEEDCYHAPNESDYL